MNTQVKVKCIKNDRVGDDNNMIHFHAPVDDVNVNWAKYTPYLDYKMSVIDSVAKNFEVNKEYMLTLSPVE